jgi:SAM-dependent methyltransferase
VWVEVGAGARARPGFLALDVNPKTADIVASGLALPFRDGSIEKLRAVDVLEHLSYRHTDAALDEWARVCAPGASLYVQVPDAETIMRWFAAGDERLQHLGGPGVVDCLEGAEWRLLGGHGDGKYVDDEGDWRWNAHYSLWSRSKLNAALDRAGFDVVTCQTNRHPNLLCVAERRYP